MFCILMVGEEHPIISQIVEKRKRSMHEEE
jgi:hypothetical protein